MKTHVAAGIIALLIAPAVAHATAQAPDRLRIDTTDYVINTNPLEPFLRDNPELRPRSDGMNSGNWRGYVAWWVIKNDSLRLTDMTVISWKLVPDSTSSDGRGIDVEHRSVFKQVFPNSDHVLALWFTGYLVVPTGELVEYVHMAYASEYSAYLLIRVEAGRILDRQRLDIDAYRSFRNKQFERYKRTRAFTDAVQSLRDAKTNRKRVGEQTDAEMEKFFYDYAVGEYTSTIFDE